VVGHRAKRNPGALGDATVRGAGDAPLGDDSECRVDDAIATFWVVPAGHHSRLLALEHERGAHVSQFSMCTNVRNMCTLVRIS